MADFDLSNCGLETRIENDVLRALIRHFNAVVVKSFRARGVQVEAITNRDAIEAEAWRLAYLARDQAKNYVDDVLEVLIPDMAPVIEEMQRALREAVEHVEKDYLEDDLFGPSMTAQMARDEFPRLEGADDDDPPPNAG